MVGFFRSFLTFREDLRMSDEFDKTVVEGDDGGFTFEDIQAQFEERKQSDPNVKSKQGEKRDMIIMLIMLFIIIILLFIFLFFDTLFGKGYKNRPSVGTVFLFCISR